MKTDNCLAPTHTKTQTFCHRWRCAVLLCLSSLAFVPAAFAQRVALIIGNAAYETKPLRNPVNDAQDIAAELKRAGFIVMPHTNLNRRGLNAAIRQFTTQAESAQLAVVYYSGHGMQSAGENYLIPTDAHINDEKDIRSEGIPLRDILGDLDDAKVQKTVVILDACRDNPFQTRTRSGKKGLARVETTGNATVVAFATADGKTAEDGMGRNGVYTSALLDQLRQPAQDIRDLLDETANTVARKTNDQKPKIYGDTGAFKGVYLNGKAPTRTDADGQMASMRTEPTGLPVQNDPDTSLWNEVKVSGAREYLEVYIKQFPKGKYLALAKLELKKLYDANIDKHAQEEAKRQQTAERVRVAQLATSSHYSTVGSYPITDCVKDNTTGLTWEGKPANGERAGDKAYTNFGDMRNGDASVYADTVNALRLCGYNDWRLPTKDELMGLVAKGGMPNIATIDNTWFFNTRASWYWTSSAAGTGHAWGVDFSSGFAFSNLRYGSSYLRLVR